MVRGLPASIAFHAALIAAGYVGWPFMSATMSEETEAILVPIELVDLGAINNIAPVRTPDPEPEEEIAPEEPEDEPEDEQPLEDPDPIDETLPEDEIDTASAPEVVQEIVPEEITPDLNSEPEQEPEPEETEPEPETKQAVVKPDNPFDDFLNEAASTFESERETRREREEEPPAPEPLLQDTPPAPQEQRRGAGERNANTARLESIMYGRILPCWDGVGDLPNSDDLNVKMNLELNQDGSIDNLQLISPARAPIGRSPMRTAVERALGAVRQCAPYNLPSDEYANWREINVNLGPDFIPTNAN